MQFTAELWMIGAIANVVIWYDDWTV